MSSTTTNVSSSTAPTSTNVSPAPHSATTTTGGHTQPRRESGFFHKLKEQLFHGETHADADYDVTYHKYTLMNDALLKLKANTNNFIAGMHNCFTYSNNNSIEFSQLLEDMHVPNQYQHLASTYREAHHRLTQDKQTAIERDLQEKVLKPIDVALHNFQTLTLRIARRNELHTNYDYYQNKVKELQKEQEKRTAAGKGETSATQQKMDRNVEKLNVARAEYQEEARAVMNEIETSYNDRTQLLGPALVAFANAERQFLQIYATELKDIDTSNLAVSSYAPSVTSASLVEHPIGTEVNNNRANVQSSPIVQSSSTIVAEPIGPGEQQKHELVQDPNVSQQPQQPQQQQIGGIVQTQQPYQPYQPSTTVSDTNNQNQYASQQQQQAPQYNSAYPDATSSHNNNLGVNPANTTPTTPGGPLPSNTYNANAINTTTNSDAAPSYTSQPPQQQPQTYSQNPYVTSTITTSTTEPTSTTQPAYAPQQSQQHVQSNPFDDATSSITTTSTTTSSAAPSYQQQQQQDNSGGYVRTGDIASSSGTYPPVAKATGEEESKRQRFEEDQKQVHTV